MHDVADDAAAARPLRQEAACNCSWSCKLKSCRCSCMWRWLSVVVVIIVIVSWCEKNAVSWVLKIFIRICAKCKAKFIKFNRLSYEFNFEAVWVNLYFERWLVSLMALHLLLFSQGKNIYFEFLLWNFLRKLVY